MSSTVEERVVQMNWDGNRFSQGVSGTLNQLDALKNSLRMDGATQGLEEVSNAASRFDSSPMEQGAGRIGVAFSSAQAIAFGALASIGAKAVAIGSQVASAFTIEPLKAGFQEYETNMTSIQTILANTKASGAGLNDVEAALQKLNDYSDDTIYNFSEMAKNIGTFTAAGVNLETSTNSIKGIANLAAISGSNSEQAAGAMYQLSQAISAGKVSLEDWNSVQNAGMGGTIFQRALAETAVAMGKIDKGALSLTGDMKNVSINGESFRNSISAAGGGESWLTSDVLTNTLAQFTGDLSDADLAAQGFNASQIEAIKAQAATATAAATEVKTFSGLMDTLKEGVSSGWGKTFQILFGDFEESKALFTSLSNSIGGFLGRMSDSRNNMLQGFKDLGGRTVLIEGLKEAFWALASPLAVVGQAFRQVFPATTSKQLYDMVVAFRDFMLELQMSAETADRLRRTFAGVFAVLHIGWELIKGLAGFFFGLFAGVEEGDKGILKITATIGDFLVGLDKMITQGRAIPEFFDMIREALFKVINPIKDFGQTLGDMTDGLDLGSAGSSIGSFLTNLLALPSVGDLLSSAFGKVVDVFHSLMNVVKPLGAMFGDAFGGFGQSIIDAFSNMDYDSILGTIQTGLLAGLVVIVKKAMSGFSIFGKVDVGGGVFEKIKDTLDGVTGSLTAMQNALKAVTLLQIAAAIGILAIAVIALSQIDADGLKRALAAITVMFIQLGVALQAFSSIGTAGQMAKLILMGAALILIASAITILARAVERMAAISLGDLARGLLAVSIMLKMLGTAVDNMSGNEGKMIATAAGLVILAFAIRVLVSAVEDLAELDWNELTKGLLGVGVLLAGLTLFAKYAEADTGGLSQGLGLLLLAAAIKVLASAVKDFADMSWGEMIQGLLGVSVAIRAISGVLKTIPKGAVFSAAAVAIIAGALKLIASAISDMGDMDWGTISKGLAVMAVSLRLISSALSSMPPQTILSAAAVLIVAASLSMLGDALEQMGSMSIGELAKGLIALGIALRIISSGVEAMEGAIRGAAALMIIAVALNVLVPALQAMGDMSLGDIVQSLLMLAGVFIILGVAGTAMAVVAPVILILAAGIALLGVAMLAAGLGVLAFSAAMTALAAVGAVGAASIVAIVSSLVGLIPLVMTQIGLGIIAFAEVIATSGPAILGAITAVLTAFLQAIIDVTPKVGETLLVLIFTALGVLEQAVPRLVTAGLNLILGLLRGIRDNIGQIVTVAAEIIVNFLNALAQKLPSIIQAGIDLIISFVNGIANGIRDNSYAMGQAGGNLATAIVEGMVKGIGGGIGAVVKAAKDLAKGALNAAKDFLGINSPSKAFTEVGQWSSEGMAIGLTNYSDKVASAASGVGSEAVHAMKKSIAGLGDLISADMDMTPVITPVLDMSSVRRDASSLTDLLATAPFEIDGAYASARAALAGYNANAAAASEDTPAGAASTTVTMTQINNSPKTLSAIEIYRQTSNQISAAKGALRKK